MYLRQRIALEKRTEKEVERGITLAGKKFWSLKHNILKGPFSNKNKSLILNACVLPTMIYGSQTWTMTKKEENKIRVTQNTMERSILGIKKSDKIKVTTIKEKLRWGNNFVWAAKRLKWDWAGHVARQNENRWTYRIKNWFLKKRRKKKKTKNDMGG